jgi:orotate phosphoribosyltransferase
VILLDDIMHSGLRLRRAVEVLRGEGIAARAIFTVLDYRKPEGAAWASDEGLPVHALFGRDAFLTLN